MCCKKADKNNAIQSKTHRECADAFTCLLTTIRGACVYVRFPRSHCGKIHFCQLAMLSGVLPPIAPCSLITHHTRKERDRKEKKSEVWAQPSLLPVSSYLKESERGRGGRSVSLSQSNFPFRFRWVMATPPPPPPPRSCQTFA